MGLVNDKSGRIGQWRFITGLEHNCEKFGHRPGAFLLFLEKSLSEDCECRDCGTVIPKGLLIIQNTQKCKEIGHDPVFVQNGNEELILCARCATQIPAESLKEKPVTHYRTFKEVFLKYITYGGKWTSEKEWLKSYDPNIKLIDELEYA